MEWNLCHLFGLRNLSWILLIQNTKSSVRDENRSTGNINFKAENKEKDDKTKVSKTKEVEKKEKVMIKDVKTKSKIFKDQSINK